MYVFGGKGDEGKLQDTWKFNFQTREWTFITDADEDGVPVRRSGHTSGTYGPYMVIYGGIHDVCKELNDMHLFDLRTD